MEKDLEYYEKLDKRTKEYKEWKANREAEASPKGLGDSIEKITKATGIADVVKFVAGEDCGCDERKEKLNELFPYKTPQCLKENEYNWLSSLYESESGVLSASNQKRLYKIYNRVFGTNKQGSGCTSCVIKVYNEMKDYFFKYNEEGL
jgi:hypothetical protein